MKKILYISLSTLLCLNLFANNGLLLKKIPLDKKFLSTENGGDKYAIDAYSDGVGIYTVGLEDKKFSSMNQLVFSHGEEAKKNEEPLKEFVLSSGNEEEKKLASFLGDSEPIGTVIGDSCDDGNEFTFNDVFIDTNGTCKGERESNSVKCKGEPIGSTFLHNGNTYVVVDNTTISSNLSQRKYLCTSNVTSMVDLFYGKSVGAAVNLNEWDTSNVTDMSYMFASGSINPKTFNINNVEKEDITNWDTSKVVSMKNMFQGVKSFNQNINKWDVSNVKDMSYMFESNQEFNNSLSNWDISNVENLSFMFSRSMFNQPLNNWNTTKVKNMKGMFYVNSKFNQPLNNWDVSNVEDINFMFSYSIFNQPLNNWDTSNVLGMMATFQKNPAFNQDINSWNVSKVQTTQLMFSEATSFNQSLNNWDTSNVTFMEQMFYKSSSFNQPLNNWNVSKVTGMNNMFTDAIKFNQDLSNWCVTSVRSTPVTPITYQAYNFNVNTPLWVKLKRTPVWGTCP